MRLPDGTQLLVIDPTEHGTTAVRAALRRAGDRTAEQGVRWRDDATRAHGRDQARITIDARADLADLDPVSLRGTIPGLDPRRVHALISVRALARAQAREWQGLVLNGLSLDLEAWLARPPAETRIAAAPSAWLGSRQRLVVERWVEGLGPERVTVVVPCIDHLDVVRTLEALAGLDPGTLGEDDQPRDLTLAETEAIRTLNAALDSQRARGTIDRSRIGSFAAARMSARAPADDELDVSLPAPADESIGRESAALMAAIDAAGVRVIGDLACLSERPPGPVGTSGGSTDLPSEAAALLALGIVDGLRLGRDGGATPYIEARDLAGIPARRLIAEVALRPAKALGGAVRAGRERAAATARRADIDQRASSTPPPLALPAGARLLHIGPSKTGTTALQAALDRARTTVLQQGVRYVGWRRHARAAVLEATGRPSRNPLRATREWRALVHELRTAREARTIFSSEELAHADSEFIERFVGEIGAADVHIAVTLRPLARILPSVWQEGVKSGTVTPFETWLRRVLLDPPAAPGFWQRHRHDALIRRWAAVVGNERVTAIVVDERDPTSLPRAFEDLLGLRPATLQLHRDLSNRSLTRGEIEAVRTLSSLLDQEGLGPEFRRIVVGQGVSYRMRLRDPDPAEERIGLPTWAEDAAARIAREMVDGIAASGVHVVGDPSALSPTAPARPSGSDQRPHVPPAAAAAMAMGVLEAAGLVASPAPNGAAAEGPPSRAWIATKLAIMPARELSRIVIRRAGRSGRVLVRRAAGRISRGAGAPA